MTLDELYLNINTVSFDNIVCQTEIKTEEDKKKYCENGYLIQLTVDEFKEKFNINPDNIWYTDSLSMTCFYYNKETLAVAPFHIEFYLSGIGIPISLVPRVFEEIEKDVEENNYVRCFMNLPDNMKLEYIKMITEKKGKVPNLYQMFMETYTESDYGFNNIDRKTFDMIIETMPEEEDERINNEINSICPNSNYLTVYRGGNTASTPYDKAYSWTLDKNVANFFASRRGTSSGYIATGAVWKQDIISYNNDRNEQEIIVYPENVKDIFVMEVKGLDFMMEVTPNILETYHKFRDMLDKVWDNRKEEFYHGKSHSARVMLLSLIIGEMLNIPTHMRDNLCIASIYHDLGRTNDEVDELHGKESRRIYEKDFPVPNPIVGFLIEYHCKDDAEGFHELYTNKKLTRQRMKAELLFNIFKDADALDRVRFGNIKGDLDLDMLRFGESKQLTLIARLCKECIKV